MTGPSRLATAAWTALALALSSTAFCGQAIADCIRADADLKLGKSEPVKVRDYLCRTQGDDPARLKIRFMRLNSMAMSALVAGKRAPSLDVVFNRSRLFDNAVVREFKMLVDKFGSDDTLSDSGLTFSSPAGGRIEFELPPYGERQKRKKQTVRVLIEREADGTAIDYPDAAAVLALERTRRTPAEYTDAGSGLLWRYMSPEDLENYEASMRQYNRTVAPAFQNYYPYSPEFINLVSPDISLLRHIGRAGWPARFTVITGYHTGNGCADGGWVFKFYRRIPVIDVAVIRNVSGRTIRIDELIGVQSPSEALRPQIESRRLRRKRAGVVASPAAELKRGDRLVMVTRIMFAASDDLRKEFKDATGPKPEMENYVYGPELALKGLTVDGERVEFEGRSANFLALTTSCECGSCPYVEAWDAEHLRWRNQGKIIHQARGRAAEADETIVLDGLVTRFRIAEREAEAAFINHVALTIELADGQRLTVAPDAQSLIARDARYARLLFGQALEIAFNAPPGLDRGRVRRSHLTVSGYYRRYSDMIAERVARERPSPLPQLQ